MSPQISIIVPIWNAAQTIARCVESIQSQSFTDWELLLSDDGSLDDSLSLCQALSAQDSRIRVIANTHQGVSHTRNVAIQSAHGQYLCFVDADDVVDPDYLEVFYSHRDYDMVVSGYWVDLYTQEGVCKSQEERVQPEQAYTLHQKSEMTELFLSGTMNINCNKLLHKDIIDRFSLQYKPYPVNEDFIFMLEYLQHCQTFYVAEKATYHWIRVENNQTGVDSLPDNILDIYNESHFLLRQFFGTQSQIGDQVMYFSYEILVIQYLQAISDGRMLPAQGKALLDKCHNNQWVIASLKAHKPQSIGESVFYRLLYLGWYRLYWFLRNHI